MEQIEKSTVAMQKVLIELSRIEITVFYNIVMQIQYCIN